MWFTFYITQMHKQETIGFALKLLLYVEAYSLKRNVLFYNEFNLLISI